MHRVIGIITDAKDAEEADTKARAYLDQELDNNASWLDWYQGVKESGRWSLKESPDKPVELTTDFAKQKCRSFIEAAQRDFNEWYQTARQSLEKNGFANLEETCSYFRIACSGMSVWLFDDTDYSKSYIRDFEMLDKIINHSMQSGPKVKGKLLWLCLLDTHN